MNAFQLRWRKERSWGVPLAYAAATITVGMILPRVEHYFLPGLASTMSVASAVAICSSISSGMIAMTGIVFTLTFVMVQFSATAYSPRLVLWVARDPVVSHSLGVFTSTFLYALFVIAWMDRSASGIVPFFSGWLVFATLLASMGMFVALVERIGMLQVNRMLIYTGDHGRKAIVELYSALNKTAIAGTKAEHRSLPVAQTVTYVGKPQVIQAVHVAEMVRLAQESGAVIEMFAAVGDTVIESTPLLRVYQARQALDEAALKNGIQIGDERTFEQDPKYAVRILVDIAIKALSPAINDPTTAVQALDQIEDLLIRLGRRQLDIGDYHDDKGALRLVVPFPTWDDFMRLALDEIRYCGASSVQVMRRMNALIDNLIEVLPAERHAVLRRWEKRLQDTVERTFAHKEEQVDASVADRQGLGIGDDTSGDAK